ncbi:MAG TPA: peptidoglycan-binding protein [Micromonosporaceae bacterium]|nr:peptidoglycan-binding protein [Micromonosporaceae bacterium]
MAVVAGAAAAAAIGFGGASPGTASGSDLPPASATVARQTLVDTEKADGELGYGTTRTATGRLAGTITSMPAVGTVVKRGQVLYAVDNSKVVLLYGTLPAYRTLQDGVAGTDVKQFEQNLKALGYTGFTVDEDYTSGTADAVREWQEDLGLDQTGRVEHGRVVYASNAVRIDSHEAEVGDAAQPGQAVLTFTGTSRVVTVELDVDDQRLAKKGGTVAVTLPDGKRVNGTITNVETVISTSSSAGGNGQSEPETKIEVTIALADASAVSGLDQASVEVSFTASERKNVLTVPVAALLALSEGGYGVQVVEGTTTRVVAVQTGLFAGGRVEVSGDDIAEGMTVGMPE